MLAEIATAYSSKKNPFIKPMTKELAKSARGTTKALGSLFGMIFDGLFGDSCTTCQVAQEQRYEKPYKKPYKKHYKNHHRRKPQVNVTINMYSGQPQMSYKKLATVDSVVNSSDQKWSDNIERFCEIEDKMSVIRKAWANGEDPKFERSEEYDMLLRELEELEPLFLFDEA